MNFPSITNPIITSLSKILSTSYHAADDSRDHSHREIRVAGITDSAASLACVQIAAQCNRSVVYVVDDTADPLHVVEELRFWVQQTHATAYITALPEKDAKTRVAWLYTLLHIREPRIIVVNSSNVADKTVGHAVVSETVVRTFSVGTTHRPTTIAELFTLYGFSREDEVADKGEFSVRGAILDVWQPSSDMPVRMVFDGDTIETIYTFDPASQRSHEKQDHLTLFPCIEDETQNLIEYFSPDEYVIWYPGAASTEYASLLAAYACVRVDPFAQPGVLDAGTQQLVNFQGNWDVFSRELAFWKQEQYTVLLVAYTDGTLKRIHAVLDGILTEQGYTAEHITFAVGALQRGFIAHRARTVVVTEHELLNHEYEVSTPDATQRYAHTPDVFKDVSLDYKKGDFVVHTQYGIGRFLGFQRIESSGREHDFIAIEYDHNDKLYVPMHDFSCVHLYLRDEGVTPQLDSLGGMSWQRTKERVQKRLLEMAEEIVAVQAQRNVLQGITFKTDTLEDDFRATFPYEETRDQKQAIDDVLKDMASQRPMERLVCGDVGYGKTEVAIRAAMRSVVNGKQTAILVPTTVLAEQHYATFSKRFAAYPVRIGLLSRFQSSKEKAETIKGLEQGTIDIVISAHSILRRAIHFPSLGLVIIDEEHRFGVKDKERMKKMCAHVDVLMLSATPIPRTLSMALNGLKDISLIETPPPHRQMITTHIGQYDTELVRHAIRFELNRKGQVFYVFNRIDLIERKYDELTQLVPEARIAIAHGQMPALLLEKNMKAFLDQKINVLLATTIVESGLDIPSVNMMIIDRVERLGLSELYQLRGRVGRGYEKAFCYMLYPKGVTLNDTAIKRLQAVQECAGFGSGFKLALRDLEIRGAGNVLGKEQHGYIKDVGLELYTEMLEQAVTYVQTGDIKEDIRPEIDLGFDAYVPDTYIKNPAARVTLYKTLLTIEHEDDVQAIEEDCVDRFGAMPVSVQNLLFVARLRVLAKQYTVASLKEHSHGIDVTFAFQRPFDPLALIGAAKTMQTNVSFHPGNDMSFTIRHATHDPKMTHHIIKKVLQALG